MSIWPKSDEQPALLLATIGVALFATVWIASFPASCIGSPQFAEAFKSQTEEEYSGKNERVAPEAQPSAIPAQAQQASQNSENGGVQERPRHGAAFCDWAGHWSARSLADPVALFTGFLFFSTTLLWLSTRRLWRGAEKQAVDFQRSVEASEKAARAMALQTQIMADAEKGVLGFSNQGFSLETKNDSGAVVAVAAGDLMSEITLLARISNSGKTTARVIRIAVHWYVGEQPLHPYELIQEADWKDFNFGIRDGRSEPFHLNEQPFSISTGNMARIKNREADLWVFGLVRYTNIVETAEIGFMYRWEEVTNHPGNPRGFVGANSPINVTRVLSKNMQA